jgi:RNA polymerase sigma-70 factor (ECF subfamily)
MTDPTDAELIRRIRESGDTAAFGQLVKRYQGHVYGLAYSLLRDWAEAQDLTQETFVRAYVNLGALREPDRFAAWLRRVAFGTCMDWLKAYRPELYRSIGDAPDLDEIAQTVDAMTPPELAARSELAENVLIAVHNLPSKYRLPLMMFHLDGLSYEKVAEFLDIPIGTAKWLIHRAKQMLKPALEAYATEVSAVVEETFNEHKLPKEFAERIGALVKAASSGDVKTVKALLDADPSLAMRKDERGVPPIQSAGSNGHREIVDLLLARGADINAKDDASQWSALNLAAIYGRTDVVNFLIERGAELDLFSACCLAKLDRVKELLATDPELVHARGPDGATPLHFAVGWHVEKLATEQGIEPTAIASLLIDRGADVNAKDLWHGGSVLRWSGLDGVIAQFLLKHGAQPDIFEAADLGDVARIRELLDADPSLINARTRSRDTLGGANTPLHRACWQDRTGAARLLLDRGADIEAVDGDHGATPLIYCAWRANLATANLLLDRGVKIDATNKYGETAVAVARMGAHGGLKVHQWARPADNYGPLVLLLEAHERKPN